MSDDAKRAAELLNVQRGHIDNLDAILVYTLAERFKATQAVGRLKAEHELPPSDPAREARALAYLARRPGLAPFALQGLLDHTRSGISPVCRCANS